LSWRKLHAAINRKAQSFDFLSENIQAIAGRKSSSQGQVIVRFRD